MENGAHVILRDVTINQGNAYNTSTGEFTAPYDGYYFFTATVVGLYYSTFKRYYSDTHLMVDGSVVNKIPVKSVNYYETGTCTYAAHLTKGQRVWLRSGIYGFSYFSSLETSFSGFLVRADD
nr:hypothetical protein BaRGS_010444 [Batillaria attramentaria]